jgi:hypothetical protein
MAYSWLEERRKKRQLHIMEMDQTISLLNELGEATSPSDRTRKSYEDPDEDAWIDLSKGGGVGERGLDAIDQATQRKEATKAFYKNAHARNIVRLITKYVVGRGFSVTPESTVPMVREYWDLFKKVNKMILKRREIVRRALSTGEAFLRFFPPSDTDVPLIRFMNPDYIQEPDDPKLKALIKGNASHGIETNSDDIEDVLAYWYKGERIDASEVYHIKILVDSDVKRGRSYLEVVLPLLAMYTGWLKDRMKLNKVRAVVGLLRKVTGGSSTQTANIADQDKTTKNTNPDGSSQMRMPEGVSVFTTKNVDYDMKSPNLQASDVQHDGRALLLAVSAGVGLPEFMVTSDASNSSYASTMVAEGPAVMEIEDWQDFFGFHFGEIFKKVIETGIASGQIPEKASTEDWVEKTDKDGNLMMEKVTVVKPVSTEAVISFPDVAVNDIEKETKALLLQLNAELVSTRTASSKLGYDYEKEQAQRLKDGETDTGDTEDEPDEDADDNEERGTEPVRAE